MFILTSFSVIWTFLTLLKLHLFFIWKETSVSDRGLFKFFLILEGGCHE